MAAPVLRDGTRKAATRAPIAMASKVAAAPNVASCPRSAKRPRLRDRNSVAGTATMERM